MKQILLNYQNLSRADKNKVFAVLTFMGVLLIILGFLVGMLLREQSFEFSLPSLPVQRMPTTSIPTPDYSEALAEIGVLEAGRSGSFGTSLKIEISVYNFGTLPFTLSESNVTLTQPDGTVLALKSSDPGFPAGIQPGETKTIELNFETPSSPTATLKILTAEYDIEGY